MMIEAYPLRWPDGWPRTQSYRRESDSRFGGRGKLEQCLRRLPA
jgi:hypothetical protein